MESSTMNARAGVSVGRWFTRVLAVLAVAGAAIALFVVISNSLESSPSDGKGGERSTQKREQKAQSTPQTVVVQPGDTLAQIAEDNGVTVERIEQLNPEIDPQALPSGATLKLR
jgi:LysM repeat protein